MGTTRVFLTGTRSWQRVISTLLTTYSRALHGFRNTEDYWHRASSKPLLSHIRVPALVVNALNDPFVPASSLPRAGEVGPCGDAVATQATVVM